MNFEYGCQITNRYNLFIDREDDGNEILAEVNTEKSSKPSKETQKTQSKTNNKGTTKQKDKESKKQPLQQQTDNSVKSFKSGETKTKQTQQSKDSRPNQNRTQTPREDKENSDNNKQRQQSQQGNREFSSRKPRGEAGFNNDGQRRDNNEGPRPPRHSNRPPRPRPVDSIEGGYNQESTDNQSNVANNESGQNTYVNRRGGGGGGRGFSGRGGRGGNFSRRRPQAEREFDRHSGSDKTGVKAIDKKDGAGKSNWGTITDELAVEEQTEEKQNEETNEEKKNWADRVDENEQKEDETEESKDVVKLMTLDEYKALKNEVNKKNQIQFNIRQAGEGEAPNKWNNLTLLKKKIEDEDDENTEDDNEELEDEDGEQDEDEKKKLLNQIKIQFYEPTNKFSRGGGSNNRGQREKRPPRNKGSRTSNQDSKVPSFQNELDFPSLSKN